MRDVHLSVAAHDGRTPFRFNKQVVKKSETLRTDSFFFIAQRTLTADKIDKLSTVSEGVKHRHHLSEHQVDWLRQRITRVIFGQLVDMTSVAPRNQAICVLRLIAPVGRAGAHSRAGRAPSLASLTLLQLFALSNLLLSHNLPLAFRQPPRDGRDAVQVDCFKRLNRFFRRNKRHAFDFKPLPQGRKYRVVFFDF